MSLLRIVKHCKHTGHYGPSPNSPENRLMHAFRNWLYSTRLYRFTAQVIRWATRTHMHCKSKVITDEPGVQNSPKLQMKTIFLTHLKRRVVYPNWDIHFNGSGRDCISIIQMQSTLEWYTSPVNFSDSGDAPQCHHNGKHIACMHVLQININHWWLSWEQFSRWRYQMKTFFVTTVKRRT